MNKIKYILFDWGGTLAFSGTRDIFLHSPFPSEKRSVLKKDTFYVLRQLKSLGKRMAIVTNTDKCIGCMLRSLRSVGIDKYFDFVIFSNGEGMCKKPCKKIFKTAINKSGVYPDEILFIGNDFLKDILGADNVGLNTGFLADTHQMYSFGKKCGFYNEKNIGRILLRSLSDIIQLF